MNTGRQVIKLTNRTRDLMDRPMNRTMDLMNRTRDLGDRTRDILSRARYKNEKLAYIYLTDRSRSLAQDLIKLSSDRNLDSELLYFKDFKKSIDRYFNDFDYLVFIMASGIAIRTIAPFIRDKFTDPAVIVMDELGINVISILGGHMGGANEMTAYIANKIGGNPVITTATDINDKGAFDLLVKKLGANVDNIRELSLKYNSSILKGQGPYIYIDPDLRDLVIGIDGWEKSIRGFKNIDDRVIDLNYEINNNSQDESKTNYGIIVISDKLDINKTEFAYLFDIQDSKCEIIRLVPRINVLGIGCRKNTASQVLDMAINTYLEGQNIDVKSIDMVGSIDLKRHERAILDFCDKESVKSEFFASDQLVDYEDLYERSDFVKKVTGVSSVAEPSCHILCEGNLIGKKYKKDGITLSLGRYKRWNR